MRTVFTNRVPVSARLVNEIHDRSFFTHVVPTTLGTEQLLRKSTNRDAANYAVLDVRQQLDVCNRQIKLCSGTFRSRLGIKDAAYRKLTVAMHFLDRNRISGC